MATLTKQGVRDLGGNRRNTVDRKLAPTATTYRVRVGFEGESGMWLIVDAESPHQTLAEARRLIKQTNTPTWSVLGIYEKETNHLLFCHVRGWI